MSANPGTLEQLAKELGAALSPLAELDASNVAAVFAALGLQFPPSLSGDAQLMAAINSVAADAKKTASDTDSLVTAITAGNEAGILASGIAVIEDVRATISAFEALAAAIQAIPPGGGVTAAQIAAFAAALPQRLLDYLLVGYLETVRPTLGGILALVGVIDRTPNPGVTGDPTQPPYIDRVLHLSRLIDLFENPSGLLKTVTDWGDPAFNGSALMQRLYDALDSFALPITLVPPPPALPTQIQTPLFDLRVDTSVNPPGLLLALKHGVSAAIDEKLVLSPEWSVHITSTAALVAGLAVGIRPPQSFALKPPAGTLSGQVLFDLQGAGSGGAPIELFGETGKSRMEIATADAGVGVSFAWDAATAAATGEFVLKLGVTGGNIAIDTSDGDGFIATLLSGVNIQAPFQAAATWKPSTGLQFTGGGALEFDFPTHISLGPVEIKLLHIVAGFDTTGIPLELSAGIDATLGPLVASVDRLGVTAHLAFPNDRKGNCGPLDLQVGFKPPSGVGLAVDAGPISGGGYLYVDPPHGEYDGILALEFADFLSLTAIGLITTKMPDGSNGFSLLIIITVDFGPGIQLGFGFTLNAVGGLVGLNRMMLFGPLADGIRTGSINDIMFPNPNNLIANAPRIISDLRAIFPPKDGTFLVGPMAKLGWGEPTLLSLSLGVIVEIPPGDIAILGILKLALPADDIAVVVIQVNFLGALEFDKQRVWFFASLFDSRILFITIEGEMGVLFAYGDDPNFVVSVGGFHPQFNPPPLPFPSPRRIEVDIINESFARIRCDGYFAVTSNSFQFGSHSEFFFGFSALSLQGHSGFDALLQFSPFHFSVSIDTSFSVEVFGLGVYGIDLSLTLEGPTKWHASGTASISFLFFSIGIGVDFTWGDDRNTALPPVAVLPILAGEFSKQSNWQAVLPNGSNLSVTLRSIDPVEAAFVLHPVGTLHVSQRAVPLDLTLDKVGNQAPSDANRFALTVESGGLAATRTLTEKFALAQFKNYDDAAKLSLQAYSPQDSGLELSAAGNVYASGTSISDNVRYELTILDTAKAPKRIKFYEYNGALFTHFLGGSSVARSAFSAKGSALVQPFTDHVSVNAESFAVAHQADNTVFHPAAAAFTSQASANDYLTRAIGSDASLAGMLHVIPGFEVAA